jgi:hypothetical protein
MCKFKTFFLGFTFLARNVIFSAGVMARNVISLLSVMSRIGIRSKPVHSQKEIEMFNVLSNTRNSRLYLIVAVTIVAIVLLTLAVVPSIAVRAPANIPVTGSQNAYVEFLRGEKAVYASPLGLSEALSAYHLGEKAIYTNAVDSSSALSTYRLGEKAIYTNTVNTALSAWRSGEKGLVGSDALEAALLTWRMGEKDIK